MKIGDTLYVVVDGDGEITGNGGSPAIYSDEYYAKSEIRDGMLMGDDLRIVKTQLTESPDDRPY